MFTWPGISVCYILGITLDIKQRVGAETLNDKKSEWPKSRNSKLSNLKCRKAIITNDFRVGGGQNLEGRNVERPIFRNFKIANTKMTKD